MGTRTYTVTFAAPGQAELPAGRFFFVKNATAALDIEAEVPGAPVRFTNVGAGLKYKGADRWRVLRITSASIQNVDIVISEESEVDIASTVSVTGSVTVVEQPSTTITSQAKTALATGNSVDIPANPARKRITIQNWSDSAGNFCVRDTAATADAGEEVQAGMGLIKTTTAAIRIRNNSGANVNYSWNEEA